MYVLAISLLAILAGTLLLVKSRKDNLGKFFSFVSWFFIVVGFMLFIGFIAGGICRLRNYCRSDQSWFQKEMMMKKCCPGIHKGPCQSTKEMTMKNCCPGMHKDPCCRPKEAPAPVRQAFSAKFPAATDVKYEIEDDEYEIDFKDKGIEMSANFDAAGKWLETEVEINESGLPKEVTSSIGRNFAGFRISEVDQVETPEKGLIYEIDLIKDKEGYEVQFNPKGDILKKEPLKEEEEKEGK